MNKQEVVEAVAKRLGVTRARAGEITDLFFSQGGIIASELKASIVPAFRAAKALKEVVNRKR